MTSVTNEQLRTLLLGRSASEEVTRLEEAILTEEGVAERLREEEFDLIDDYARGKLSPSERADMERYVLNTPQQMESLQVARALAIQLAAGAAASRPASVTALTSATVGTWRKPNRLLPAAALLAAGLSAVVIIPHWSADLAPSSTVQPSVGSGVAPRAAEQTIILLLDTNRGDSKPVVHLASDAVTVRLQTEVPGSSRDASYSIRIDDAAGTAVFETSHLATRVAGPYAFVEAMVPGEALGAGIRTVLLSVDDSPKTSSPAYRWQIATVRDDIPQKK